MHHQLIPFRFFWYITSWPSSRMMILTWMVFFCLVIIPTDFYFLSLTMTWGELLRRFFFGFSIIYLFFLLSSIAIWDICLWWSTINNSVLLPIPLPGDADTLFTKLTSFWDSLTLCKPIITFYFFCDPFEISRWWFLFTVSVVEAFDSRYLFS